MNKILKCISSSFKLTWKYSKSYYLFSILILLLESSLTTLPPILILQNIINNLTQNRDVFSFNEMFLLLLLALLYEILYPIFTMLFSTLQKWLNHKNALVFSEKVYKKLISLKGDYIEDSETYSMFRRTYNRNISTFTSVVNNCLNIPVGIVTILVIVSISAKYNLLILLIYVPVCILLFFINNKITNRAIWFDRLQEQLRTRINTFSEIFVNKEALGEIKIFDSFDFLNNERQKYYLSLKKEYISKAKKSLQIDIISETINKFVYYSIYVFYGILVIANHILIGDFLLLINNAKQINNTVTKLIKSLIGLSKNIYQYDEYEQFFNLKERSSADTMFEDNRAKDISINNLSYGYDKDLHVLKNLFFEIKEGEKVCILGKNGAGKSTLVKLLCGLYEDYEGEIQIQDKRFESIKKDELENVFNYAAQEIPRYPFTVKENIILGDINKKDDGTAFRDACHLSEIDSVVSKLPKGFDTVLNKDLDADGTDFSIGQWQKLLIARILFRNKEILVFDEPTYALDPIAERDFIKTLITCYKDRTIIVISHRMVFTTIADKIIVLEDGEIKEAGNPDELLRKKGYYYDFCSTQKDLYL